jgi:thymidylate kinase
MIVILGIADNYRQSKEKITHLLESDPEKKIVVIFERSLRSCYNFINCQSFTKTQKKILHSFIDHFITNVEPQGIHICLDLAFETTLHRFQSRSRKEEMNVPIFYLRQVHQEYLNSMDKYDYVINCNGQTKDEVCEQLIKIINL